MAKTTPLKWDAIARLIQRIEIDVDTGCWLWQGRIDSGGYGKAYHNGSETGAHRCAHELMVGPIPAGYSIDHVWARGCRFRHCVNPEHLEAVSPAENTRRIREPERAAPAVGDGAPVQHRAALRRRLKGLMASNNPPSVREAARRVGIPASTARDWLKAGGQ